jgi:phenylacetate-CoA ligase
LDTRLPTDHSGQTAAQGQCLSSLLWDKLFAIEDVSPKESDLKEELPTLIGIQELVGVVMKNPAALRDYQQGQLAELLSHAVTTCEYYGKALSPNLLNRIKDHPLRQWHHLPLLNKQTVKTQLKALWSDEHVHDKVNRWMSSGSTGEPTQFMVDPFAALTRDLGMNLIQRLQGNAHIPTRGDEELLMLRLSASEGPDGWRTRMFLYLDAWLVKLPLYPHPDCDEQYVLEILRACRPRMLATDPQALDRLLHLWETHYPEESHFPYPLTSLTSGGNQLSESLRSRAEAFFQRPIIDAYGLSETSIVASQCSHGHYHLHSPFNWVEVIDPVSKSPLLDGEVGEIVVTHLMNWVFPFIRYQTGDMGALDRETQCPCGCIFPLLTQFQGRKRRYLIRPDGSLLAPQILVPYLTALNAAQYQLIQETPTQFKLRLSVSQNEPVSDAAMADLKHALDRHVGEETSLAVSQESSPLSEPGIKFQDILSLCHTSDI